MCGILGGIWYQLEDKAIINKVEQGLEKISHRGPNDKGCELNSFENGAVALGHTRLSIIDLSSGGHQPMLSHCGRYKVIFNGEIYNYKELRTQLENLGHKFITQSDTEVLVACWVEWQEQCLTQLEGMFAIVVLDTQLQTLTCVRDAFGIKPFFYGSEQNNFYFSSELPALKALFSGALSLNEQRSYDYLVHGDYDSNSSSFFNEVSQLPPATYIKLSVNQPQQTLKVVKWWSPSVVENKKISFPEAAKVVRENFLASVRKHLRSDVPIGTALSGGLDSSSLVYAIRYLEPEIELNTFSFIAEDPRLSEEKWVDRVNQDVAAVEHKVRVSPDDLFSELDNMIRSQGEPFGSTSIYAQYKVFELAKRSGVTVTLDGQGADELLAGYSGYPGPRLKSLVYQGRLIAAAKFLNRWSKWPGRTVKQGLMYGVQAMLPGSLNKLARRVSGRNFTPAWLNLGQLKASKVNMVEPKYPVQSKESGRFVIKALKSALESRGLPGLLRHADRNSMAFSIESRVPYLTIKQAEFLLSLPEHYLISDDGETKSVFRAAMRGIVPDDVLDRKDKIGFATPEADWLRKNESQLKGMLTNSNYPEMLDKGAVLAEVDSFMSGTSSDWKLVWRFINFVRWYNLQAD